MQPTLLVLAAGMGSRYGGLKQLDAVGPSGETIIDYSVFDAKRAGFGKIVFVIRHDIEEAFKEGIGSRYEKVLPVGYAFQELDALPEGFSVPEGREKPWGTAHAILCARDLIEEPFAVINGDDFYGQDGFQVLADYLSSSSPVTPEGREDYCMVGYRLRNTLSKHGSVARGICYSDAEGMLEKAVETLGIEPDGNAARYADPEEKGKWLPLTGEEIVSMNLWGFQPSLFGYIESAFGDFLKARGQEMKSEIYIPTIVNDLIQAGRARARVLSSDAVWFGVTYREDKTHVEESIAGLVKDGVYPSPLWELL